MIRENQRLLNQLHIVTDAAAVFLAMLVSYWLRFAVFHGTYAMPLSHYVWLGVAAAGLTLVVFAVAGLYASFRTIRFHVEAGRVALLELLVALIVMALMYILRFEETSRWSVAFFYAAATALLTAKRAVLRSVLRHYRAMGYNQKRVLVVGCGESAEMYLKKVISDRNLGYHVVGYVAERDSWRALPYCGDYDALEKIFRETKPDEVVVALSTEELERMPQVIGGVMMPFARDGFLRRGVTCQVRVPWDAQELTEALTQMLKKVRGEADWTRMEPACRRAAGLLSKMGMRSTLRGYEYLSSAAALAWEDESRMDAVGDMLYKPVALRFGTTEQAVERLIRHAVESVMDAFGVRRVYGFFGNSIDPIRGKPTNAEMIGMLAQYMRVTPED